LSPQIEGPPSNFAIKLGRKIVKALGYIFVKNCVILTAAVLSQYTRVKVVIVTIIMIMVLEKSLVYITGVLE